MKIFGKRKQQDQEPEKPQEPLLFGQDEPRQSKKAADLFIEVIMKAADAQRPGRIGASHSSDVDRAQELEKAFEDAAEHCNEELLSRMRAFRDAVIELSMGGGSEQEVRAAREHFTTGCRHALGNDR
jgi:hypothetical protein